MKKIIAAALLALLLMLTVPTSAAGGTSDSPIKEVHLVVGNTTPMRGEFFTDMWGNATSDIDVRDLLHAYDLVYWDEKEGMFTADPSVVSGFAVTENEAGDHTYLLVLYDDLYYSDGTRITAWDYAFSYLFYLSPVLYEIGAAPLRREQIVGYQEYFKDGAPLAGVHVISDDMLSVTLNHEYLPFFYEMGLLSCNPYPISVIAPGVEVRDDGEGVFLANIDPNAPESLFTAGLLRSTVLDPETGYQSHPSVVSGPYIITSWDGVTAEFEINPYFKGNSRSELPAISHLTYTIARNDTMMEHLTNGEYGLLNKVMRADQIIAGTKKVSEAVLRMTNYPRVGLSFISFACERATVSDVAVRSAIAYCFDRNSVVKDYIGPFGIRVDGYYGIGQWMYQIITGLIAPPVTTPEDGDDEQVQAQYEADMAAYDALNLDHLNDYALDLKQAAKILDEAGWYLNEDGLREKDGIVLDLHLICPEGNYIDTSLQTNLGDNLAKVGIRLTMELLPMQELLARWYKQDERSDDMIYLASNFDIIFDPSAHFSSDGSWSYTNLSDDELYQAAISMRTTQPGDVLTYLKHWIDFEERFNAVLPMIPVYSNVYFDFYRDDLRVYDITENVTWGQAIVGSWIDESAAEESPEEE